MNVIGSSKINIAICEALGLDPKHVGRVTIELMPRQPPIVLVEQFIVNERGVLLTKELQRFRLEPKEP